MSFQKTKIDGKLGLEVQAYLESKGVHTPVNKEKLAVDNKEKIEKIEQLMKEMLEVLGVDLTDDSLVETPNRVAKMFVLDDFWGLHPENFPKNTVIKNKFNSTSMVTVEKINIVSRCEHHLEKILGEAYISYIPKENVIGLSKLARVAEYHCKKPQVQERLTEQIYHTLVFLLGTEDIAVYINAEHLCMTTRGVESRNSTTSTSRLGGAFMSDASTRSEFYSQVFSQIKR